jgi:hypothetical protein
MSVINLVRFRKNYFNSKYFERIRGTSFDNLMQENIFNKFLHHFNILTNILINLKVHIIPQIMNRHFLNPNFSSTPKSLKIKVFRRRLEGEVSYPYIYILLKPTASLSNSITRNFVISYDISNFILTNIG